jgi:hypothetical protein
MRTPRFVFTLAILLVSAALSPANTPFDDLLGAKWCFDRDKPFYQEVTTETNQQMTVAGMNVAQKQKQTYYYRWELVKYDTKAKQWIVKQKIEGVKLNIEIGGNTVEYDSTKPGQAGNPLGAFFANLVGAEFTVTLDANLHVHKIDGGKQLLAKLNKADPQLAPIITAMLGEHALKNLVEQSLPVIPKRPAAKDGVWTRETFLDLAQIGKYRTKSVYSLQGRDAKYEKIRVEPTIEYSPPDRADAGLPFKIKNADLKSTDSEGVLYFDFKEGRIDRSETTLKLKGKLTIEIGGTDSEIDLDQTQKTTVKTSDTNLLKK